MPIRQLSLHRPTLTTNTPAQPPPTTGQFTGTFYAAQERCFPASCSHVRFRGFGRNHLFRGSGRGRVDRDPLGYKPPPAECEVAPMLQNKVRTTLCWREVDSNFPFRALNERRTAPISRGTGRPNALLSRRLPIDKITSLDARFRYLRAVSMRGVMQSGLRCYRHYTD